MLQMFSDSEKLELCETFKLNYVELMEKNEFLGLNKMTWVVDFKTYKEELSECIKRSNKKK